MLKKLVNQCTFALRIETEEPILIKSGDAVVSGPDMTFVRTRRGGKTEPFIPGSSLKGVLRSHAERIARTLKRKSVCGVFQGAEVEGCSWAFESHKNSSDYAASCPACRLFGSLHWKGRFRIGDAYLVEEDRTVQPELRDGIGIDRISGGVAGGAKFDLEVMPAGVTFETRFELVNFEVWQLGWMAYVVRDLLDGNLRIGSGTSRGMGRVRGHLDAITLDYIGKPYGSDDYILGLGALSTSEERDAYGLLENDRVESPVDLKPERAPGSLRAQSVLQDDEGQMAFLAAVAPAWNAYVDAAPTVSDLRS
jgi:CRISPR-associated RAMP protein (TIGR02581 family)